MKYNAYILKRSVEGVFIFPFILIGRTIAYFISPKKSYRTYFFFPFYHTGGAEKVHAQIANACGGKDCIIYFTRKSKDKTFLNQFISSGCQIKDISKLTDNKWLYFLNLIYRGIITGTINRQQERPVVFNGQCNFAYKISPWVKKEVKQVELIHSFNSFSFIRVPFIPFYTTTIMISKVRINDHLKFYKKIGVPEAFAARINYIPNAIEIPKQIEAKKRDPLVVLFVGRGGPEKRVHLFAEIAIAVKKVDPEIRFEILGDVSAVLEADAYPFIHFYGNESEEQKISGIYHRAAVLLLTSNTEGFPMVIIEAMAQGCIAMATPVGDIPLQIKNKETGFVFNSSEDEKLIVQEATALIHQLKENTSLLENISAAARKYAIHNFDLNNFITAYRQILKPD